jgi:hypothetical protein
MYFSFQTRNEITITPVAAQPVKAKEEVVLVVRIIPPLLCFFFSLKLIACEKASA